MEFTINDFMGVTAVKVAPSAVAGDEPKHHLSGFDALITNVWSDRLAEEKKAHSKEEAPPSSAQSTSLSYEVVKSILIEEVFPALKISVPIELLRATSQKSGSMSSISKVAPETQEFLIKINKFIDHMIDISPLFSQGGKINLQPFLAANDGLKVKYEDYFNTLHNFYFNQLRIESQTDPKLEEYLWSLASEVEEPAEDDHVSLDLLPSAVKKLMPLATDDLQELKAANKITFRLTEKGALSLTTGAVLQKKFKYFGKENQELAVLTDKPGLINIKTPSLTLEYEDDQSRHFSFVKFQVVAPKTPCVVLDAKIIIFDKATMEAEEMLIFQIDIK